MQPQCLCNETLQFNWDGSSHSAHNAAKFCDWSFSNQEQISVVKLFLSISQPVSDVSQRDFNQGHVTLIHSQWALHILCMNLQTFNIRATAQQE